MTQKTGQCTAFWNGVQCTYVGLLDVHHKYRKGTGKRGKAYQQDTCTKCHDDTHNPYSGTRGGTLDKWPDDPRFDGINKPFVCGSNP